jgi:hypothetical protein
MLPKNEKTFEISVIGEITQEKFMGSFTCVCVPWTALRNKIARDEIRESGDLDNVTTELFIRSRWLANVQSRLTSWPDWWSAVGQGARLLDDNVLKEVYDQCIEAEVEWRMAIKSKAETITPAPTPA